MCDTPVPYPPHVDKQPPPSYGKSVAGKKKNAPKKKVRPWGKLLKYEALMDTHMLVPEGDVGLCHEVTVNFRGNPVTATAVHVNIDFRDRLLHIYPSPLDYSILFDKEGNLVIKDNHKVLAYYNDEEPWVTRDSIDVRDSDVQIVEKTLKTSYK